MCTGNGQVGHSLQALDSTPGPNTTRDAAPPSRSEHGKNGGGPTGPAITALSAGVVDERDRIAAELYDGVIHRLYAAGLSLHSAAAPLRTPTAPRSSSVTVDHIDNAIRMLDDAISAIRATLYSMPDRDQQRRTDLPPSLDTADTT